MTDNPAPAITATYPMKMATILFADIIGSSEVANERSVVEYGRFIDEFQQAALETCRCLFGALHSATHECHIHGDEVCLIVYSGPVLSDFRQSEDTDAYDAYLEDMRKAFIFALGLRLRWINTRYNWGRIANQLLPREIAIGIHHGPVGFWQHPAREVPAAEGYCINLAKRIEGYARNGTCSNILCSGPVQERMFWETTGHLNFVELADVDLKGFNWQHNHLYEVKRVSDIWDLFTPEEEKQYLRLPMLQSVYWKRLRQLVSGYRKHEWLSVFSAAITRQYARKAIEDGDYPLAVMYLRQAKEYTPDWWRVINDLAVACVLEQPAELRKPLHLLEQAIELSAHNRETVFNYVCLLMTGDAPAQDRAQDAVLRHTSHFRAAEVPDPAWPMPDGWRDTLEGWVDAAPEQPVKTVSVDA